MLRGLGVAVLAGLALVLFGSTPAGPARAWSPLEAVPRLDDLPPGFQQTEVWQSDNDSYFVRFERPPSNSPGPDQLDTIGNRFPTPMHAAGFVRQLREDGYRQARIARIGDESVAFLDVNARSEYHASIAIVTFRIGRTVGSVFATRRGGGVSIHQAAQVAERVASRMALRPVPDTPIVFGPPIEGAAPAATVLGYARELGELGFMGGGREPVLVLDEPDYPGVVVLRPNNQVWVLEPRGFCWWCRGAVDQRLTLEFGYVSSTLISRHGFRKEFWTSYLVP